MPTKSTHTLLHRHRKMEVTDTITNLIASLLFLYFKLAWSLKYITRKKILTPIYLIIKYSHLIGSKCFSRCLNMRFVLV